MLEIEVRPTQELESLWYIRQPWWLEPGVAFRLISKELTGRIRSTCMQLAVLTVNLLHTLSALTVRANRKVTLELSAFIPVDENRKDYV